MSSMVSWSILIPDNGDVAIFKAAGLVRTQASIGHERTRSRLNSSYACFCDGFGGFFARSRVVS